MKLVKEPLKSKRWLRRVIRDCKILIAEYKEDRHVGDQDCVLCQDYQRASDTLCSQCPWNILTQGEEYIPIPLFQYCNDQSEKMTGKTIFRLCKWPEGQAYKKWKAYRLRTLRQWIRKCEGRLADLKGSKT